MYNVKVISLETIHGLYSLIKLELLLSIQPIGMRIIYNMRGKPSKCITTNHFECPCVFGLAYDYVRDHYFDIMEQWQDVVREVADLPEFNGRNDFTVINQPFLENVQFPRLPNGNHDFTYMSVDCFHLSQKGYAIASNALWNNMLEPYGNKSTNWQREFREFKCPTEAKPFIFTRQNSDINFDID